MLRTYTPIKHPIFALHQYLEHLVCQVWCKASDEHTCDQLIEAAFESAYKKYPWLKTGIDAVYEKCKLLSNEERAEIIEAFAINNRIEDLCEGSLVPVSLDELPQVVNDDMTSLLIDFYEKLLDRAEVPGNKLDYYNKLIKRNNFTTCPCCGLSLIETAESHYIEDNDHYLPKAEYPFAVVNFSNLVPLCSKCNKKCKGTKSPFEAGRISFYPFNGNRPDLRLNITILNTATLDYRDIKEQEIEINFDDYEKQIKTWDWLFRVKERYNEQIRLLSKTELRLMAKKFRRDKGRAYEDILNESIGDYEDEIYEDRKFLKIAFLKEIKTKPEWMAVYY